MKARTVLDFCLLVWLTASICNAQQTQEPTSELASLRKTVAELESRVTELEAAVKRITSSKPEVENPSVEITAKSPAKDSPIVLDQWSYSLVKGDFGQAFYNIKLHLRNTGTKKIKLIEGGVFFKDLLDNKIYAIRIEPDIRIAPGATFISSGSYNVNPFIPDDSRLADMQKEDIKAELVISRIVFEDNTVLKVGR